MSLAGPPVAVGGVGGSGTRLVAQLLIELGLFMGQDLNRSNDNLWFTQLFKRRLGEKVPDPDRTINAFLACSTRPRFPGFPAAVFTTAMGIRLARDAHAGRAAPALGGVRPVLRRTAGMVTGSTFDPREHRGWGWKEPITFLFLEELVGALPGFRYIHVMRHGVDMAFSENQLHLFQGYGPLLGLPRPDPRAGAEQLAILSLAWWVRANRHAVDLGRILLGERFLLLRLETLCQEPGATVDELCRFVGIEPDAAARKRLISLPQLPASVGRHKHHDLSMFDPGDVAAVEAFGYAVDR